MGLKIVGIMLIIVGCGGFGFKMAADYIKEERSLRQLIQVLEYMECELQYRLTPLPSLCRQASNQADGPLRRLFMFLAEKLETQASPDASQCMAIALSSVKNLPHSCYEPLEQLGRSMGRFDAEGQLKGLKAVQLECRRHLDELMHNRDARLRNYKTLGLCAGAAVAILLI